ncbi:MAG TPA: hypothetical protein VFQ69_02210 [Rhizomicrobium sp.]|nr:hypothetical protein [Rhizomicrobium sp.]
MADNKHAPRNGKAYIAPLVIALVIAAVLAVFMLREPPAAPQPPPPAAPASPPVVREARPEVPPPPAAPASPPVLARADLLEAARTAAGAFAEQNRLDGASDALIGRRFSIRIPFGCGVVPGPLSQASAVVDGARRTVTLSARPALWTALPLFASPPLDDVEAVEGFWIPRPWAGSDACPPQVRYPVPVTPTPPSARTVGLAQVFTGADSRLGRHAERPYEFTRKLSADDADLLDRSYRLLLEGVVTGYGDGHALRCWMESPEHQPICVFGVTFSRVAFEDGTTGDVLAKWDE